jgi:putative ABC transport system permease protein
VAGQLALSIVAAIDAGLLVQTLRHVTAADPGFTYANVSVAELQRRPGVPLASPNAETHAYYRRLLTEMLPAAGLRHVALSNGVPLVGTDWLRAVTAADASDQPVDVAYNPVSPGFLKAFNIALYEGRDFAWTDDIKHRRVAIVSRSVADRFFTDRSAIGETLHLGPPFPGQPLEIIGVINDIALYDIKHGSRLTLLVSALQDSETNVTSLVLREPASLASLRPLVSSLGHDYVTRIRPLETIVENTHSQDRVAAIAGTAFGTIAVALAGLGLYVLLMWGVSGRMREFAIRVALGGHAWAVARLVIANGLRVVTVGTVVGGLVAIVNVRWLQTLLYGIRPRDALTLSLVPMAIAIVGLLASTMPALQAANSDPLSLLRED